MAEYDAIVLGAGVIGVTTAYWLNKAGKNVAVIDRQPGAGLETSYANGGQISVSHSEPWANPGAPRKILKWLFDRAAPLLFRPRLDIHQWMWISQFMVDCWPSRADEHTRQLVRLGTHSRNMLRQIVEDTGILFDHRHKGILHFYRDEREYKSAIRVAKMMRQMGCYRLVIDSIDDIHGIEPAMKGVTGLVGATYTEDDESGDAHKFTHELAAVCAQRGVEFIYDNDIKALSFGAAGDRPSVMTVDRDGWMERMISAKNVVVCMGSHSAPFLRRYWVYLNIYPAKGYSVTVPLSGGVAPTVSLTDDENKLVFSNLGDRLRIAGTAELSGYNDQITNPRRCHVIRDKAKALFPDAGDYSKAAFWTGLRPATPSNLPYVGRTRHDGLWVNTGHGTLGWTLSAGSGQRIAEMMT